MLYQIDLNQPLLFLWAGLFTNKEPHTWRQRETSHSQNLEILLPIKNDLPININGRDQLIAANECFLVPPKAVIKPAATVDYELQFYWCHFLAAYKKIPHDAPSLQQGLHEVALLKENTSLNNTIILPKHFSLRHPEKIIVLLNQLLSNQKAYQYSQRGNDFYLTLLLMAISDDFLKTTANKHHRTVRKTALIAEWISVNITSELSLTSIADQFNLNPNYLSRLFKQEQGIGIKDYLLQIKMDRAKSLLTTTTWTITEVSEQAYFYDAKHFMRLFKQKTGLTPSQYRNEYSPKNLNSSLVDPVSPLPEQLGNRALKALLREIQNSSWK